MVKADRNLGMFVLLSIITGGIYSWIYIYELAKDMNTVCAGDGQETPGLLKYILFGIITCGIYCWIWHYQIANRMADNSRRYGLNFTENGSTVLLWMLLGTWLCGIGYFIAYNIIIKNMNALANAYNAYNSNNNSVAARMY